MHKCIPVSCKIFLLENGFLMKMYKCVLWWVHLRMSNNGYPVILVKHLGCHNYTGTGYVLLNSWNNHFPCVTLTSDIKLNCKDKIECKLWGKMLFKKKFWKNKCQNNESITGYSIVVVRSRFISLCGQLMYWSYTCILFGCKPIHTSNKWLQSPQLRKCRLAEWAISSNLKTFINVFTTMWTTLENIIYKSNTFNVH